MYTKKENIYPAYVSKHNLNREKQVLLSMISNGEGGVANSKGQRWHFLAVKKLLALLIGITFKHHSEFYCLNCFHSFATENKFQSHKGV